MSNQQNKKVKNNPKNTASKKAVSVSKKVIIICAAVLVAAAGIFALYFSLRFKIPEVAIPEYYGRDIPETESLPLLAELEEQYKYAEEYAAKGDSVFKCYAADSITFDEAFGYGNLDLANVMDNNCTLIATIVDDAGAVIYRSLGLPAGRYIHDIRLFNQELPYGQYDFKLIIAAYNSETHENVGVQYHDLTVNIGIEEETESATQETTSQSSESSAASQTTNGQEETE